MERRWERDGRDWPNREASRFPLAAGLRWHVQRLGRGPVLLLLHGTGASGHSWGDVAPLLANRFELVIPDLPGHGFSEAPLARELSLPGMAQALAGLLERLDTRPVLAMGHSAGAAILARLCLDRVIAPRALISLNGALLPLRGLPGHFFSPAARLLAAMPLVPRLLARWARSPGAVERLVQGTGSRLKPSGVEFYRRLVSHPGHVGAALSMMAHWDLQALARDLPGLTTPLFLVAADRDTTVPPAEALRVRKYLPTAEVVPLPGLGHLAHEEQPEQMAELVVGLGARIGVLPGAGVGA